MMEKKRCIYCWEWKLKSEFTSVEHIWPKAIGAMNSPDFFTTDKVCNKCNHISGVYVDGKFLKSYMVKHARNLATHSFLDPKKPKASSIHFLGIDENFPCPKDYICENYSGPAGEHIYHIRPISESEFDTYVGGNPKKQSKSKSGRVYVYLTANHPYWVVTAALSIKKAFPKSERFILTKIDGDFNFSNYWVETDKNDKSILIETEYIEKLSSEGRNVQVKIDVNFSKRFLAKVALGIGHKILGDAIFEDENAKNLQKLFKNASTKKSNNIAIKMMSFTWGEPKSPFDHFVKLDAMWIIGIMAIDGSIMLTIVMPSGHSLITEITNNPKYIEEFYRDNPVGKIYVSIPDQSKFLGPYSGLELFNHSRGVTKISDLTEIEEQIHSIAELPKKFINE